ncbi:hypothetical protein R9X48_13155 [Lacticaseibacillus rhamnosus]
MLKLTSGVGSQLGSVALLGRRVLQVKREALSAEQIDDASF